MKYLIKVIFNIFMSRSGVLYYELKLKDSIKKFLYLKFLNLYCFFLFREHHCKPFIYSPFYLSALLFIRPFIYPFHCKKWKYKQCILPSTSKQNALSNIFRYPISNILLAGKKKNTPSHTLLEFFFNFWVDDETDIQLEKSDIEII